MRMNRRLSAASTLLAVLWTALWPLVTSVHARAMAEEMPLCHQAGMVVAADEAPVDPASPSPQPAKQHCPLCIMGFLAMAAHMAVVPADRIAPEDLTGAYRDSIHPANLSTRLAASRAPPRSA
jgi:hypothetical protein